MRFYFLTCTPAVLKLNGLYAGVTDKFERRIEADPRDNILAEIVPGENLQPVNFFLDEKLLQSPPDFLDVYLAGGDVFIYVKRFESRDTRIDVVLQTRFKENLITVFTRGETYLSVEGKSLSLNPLGFGFKNIKAEENTLAGMPVLCLKSGKALIILSGKGEIIFSNEVLSAEYGQTLKVSVAFETCTAAQAECEYAYDGEKLTLLSGKTVETVPPAENILHFAFFESVLTFCDFEKYLSPELAQKAGALREYLGGFTGVTVPSEKFYLLHPEKRAAGLVYPKSGNLYEIKYFAVELKDGKVDNVYPVE